MTSLAIPLNINWQPTSYPGSFPGTRLTVNRLHAMANPQAWYELFPTTYRVAVSLSTSYLGWAWIKTLGTRLLVCMAHLAACASEVRTGNILYLYVSPKLRAPISVPMYLRGKWIAFTVYNMYYYLTRASSCVSLGVWIFLPSVKWTRGKFHSTAIQHQTRDSRYSVPLQT
jgi:hypothetical protein